MNDLETIDNYFSGSMSPEEKTRFDRQLVTNTELATAVAFYLQVKETARTESQTRQTERTERWANLRRQEASAGRRIWAPIAYAAAACVVLLLGFFFFRTQPAADQVASQYIQEQLMTLPVTMSGSADSLQLARQAYNDGRITSAETIVLALQQRDSSSAELQTLGGLVSLRQGKYDKAIAQFQRLGHRTDLRANPGLFYEALTRLKRNQPNDKNVALDLLKTVINKNLDKKSAAEGLVKRL